MLAETYVEAEQPAEAAALLTPLVEEIAALQAGRAEPQDPADLRLCRPAQLAAGQAEAAGNAALALAKLSPDEPQPNGLICRSGQADGDRNSQDRSRADVRRGRLPGRQRQGGGDHAKLREAQGQLLDAIVGRKALAIQQLIFVGDACVDLGKNQMAREIYARLLESIDKDPEEKKTAGAAVTRIRSRQVGLLRAEGELDDAYKWSMPCSRPIPTRWSRCSRRATSWKRWPNAIPSGPAKRSPTGPTCGCGCKRRSRRRILRGALQLRPRAWCGRPAPPRTRRSRAHGREDAQIDAGPLAQAERRGHGGQVPGPAQGGDGPAGQALTPTIARGGENKPTRSTPCRTTPPGAKKPTDVDSARS